MAMSSDTPWIVVGDFNVIGTLDEKEGGSTSSISKVEEMQTLISDCCLMELNFSGPKFTWSNNRPGVC